MGLWDGVRVTMIQYDNAQFVVFNFTVHII